nr:hypothetical protein [Nocardia crassostreae]
MPTKRSANILPKRLPAEVASGGATRSVVDESPGDPVSSTHKNADWAYSWVPVLGPLVGGALAGLVAQLYL